MNKILEGPLEFTRKVAMAFNWICESSCANCVVHIVGKVG